MVLLADTVDLSLYQVLDESWRQVLASKGAIQVEVENFMWVTLETEFPTYQSDYVRLQKHAFVDQLKGVICLVAKVGSIECRETAGSSRR